MREAQGLGAETFDSLYADLARFPEDLFGAIIVHPHGELSERVSGVLQWQDALMSGQLPQGEVSWPERHVTESLCSVLSELGIARFTRNNEVLTSAVLLSVLDAVTEGCALYLQSFEEHKKALEALEKARQKAKSLEKKQSSRKERSNKKISEMEEEIRQYTTTQQASEEDTNTTFESEEAILAEAHRRANEVLEQGNQRFLLGAWAELVRMWSELEEVFGELRGLLGLGWDLSQGVLSSQGWLEVARLRKLLELLPTLRELIRTLGRMQATDEMEKASICQVISEPLSRLTEELLEERTPWVPAETRGIERSASIARMLPPEAALLTHPTLKLLWHARRAEHALLCYRLEGTEWVASEIETKEEESRESPKRERGPIIVCLDTSGSMAGTPEVVAKALTLEAMRVAYQEKRACYLFTFSGPSDVGEHELSLSPEGLARLFSFLSMSFHGGTDVALPMTLAMQKLREEAWQNADILLISDGEFSVSSEIRTKLQATKDELGLRVHGVLIGNLDSSAMEILAEPLHRFEEWEALLGN